MQFFRILTALNHHLEFISIINSVITVVVKIKSKENSWNRRTSNVCAFLKAKTGGDYESFHSASSTNLEEKSQQKELSLSFKLHLSHQEARRQLQEGSLWIK